MVKLEIPEDAKRISSINISRKCRCEKAKVLDIIDLDSGEHLERALNPESRTATFMTYLINNGSTPKPPLEYVVGEMVCPDSFDGDRANECSHGIHFFINKQDAINYRR